MDNDIDDNADTGILDPEDTLDDRNAYDEGYSPPEKAPVLDEGVSLADRLAREEPDLADDDGDGLGDARDTDGELIDDEVGHFRAGRLVAQDEGFGTDSDDELYASDVGIDGGAASAEEAAVHLVDPREY
ncbi:hypothetical protein GC106_25170 [Kibdelosporangium sp. 4NS15]|uniref:DUF5709 domain-containing protein n=1 Tax=Kibdelosporangium persicum TaxID=2698649 RepID=A0ABX2F1W1_9PSEU|nr:DUF5709 domain-containing protein [Kibdelosporangium persicum]NRN65306.1 hypothetical protein [Kibdelosporangium persicum]